MATENPYFRMQMNPYLGNTSSEMYDPKTGKNNSAYLGMTLPQNDNDGAVNYTEAKSAEAEANAQDISEKAASAAVSEKQKQMVIARIAELKRQRDVLIAKRDKLPKFSDEERRMILAYTTLGDLDAGVRQIMTNRNYNTALAQSKATEDRYANEEARDKETTYENAVIAYRDFVITNTNSAGIMSEKDTRELSTKLSAAIDAGKKVYKTSDEVRDDLRKAVASGSGNTNAPADANAVASEGYASYSKMVDDIATGYGTISDTANTKNSNATKKGASYSEKFGLGNKQVEEIISAINEKRALITSAKDITPEDKEKLIERIDKIRDPLVDYKARSDAYLNTEQTATASYADNAAIKDAVAKDPYLTTVVENLRNGMYKSAWKILVDEVPELDGKSDLTPVQLDALAKRIKKLRTK
jgi:hypothetical protein